MFLVLVPLAWLLGIQSGVGLKGMWVAAVCYSIGAAIVMTLKFRGGSWKKIVI